MKRPARGTSKGVICGHIHHATIEDFDGVQYINTGDWVESCTAIGEDFDGRMHLLRWDHHIGLAMRKSDSENMAISGAEKGLPAKAA